MRGAILHVPNSYQLQKSLKLKMYVFTKKKTLLLVTESISSTQGVVCKLFGHADPFKGICARTDKMNPPKIKTVLNSISLHVYSNLETQKLR